MKYPSAWVPIVMSFAALILLFSYVLLFGVSKNEDEGLAARIFQFLLVGQVPIIAIFAFRWFPNKPKQVVQILLLQMALGLLAIATVLVLEL